MGQLRFRPMTEQDMPFVISWFDDEHFYYDTKEPSTLPRSSLEYYLKHPDSAFHIIEIDGERVGLTDQIVRKSTRYARVDLRIRDDLPQAHLQSARAMSRLISYLLDEGNVRRVERMVYGFDPVGQLVCHAAGMAHEGNLRDAAYKGGRHWPVMVYAAHADTWQQPEDPDPAPPDPYPITGSAEVRLRRPPPQLTPALVATALSGWLAGDLPGEWFPITGSELAAYRDRFTSLDIRELVVEVNGQAAATAVVECLDRENCHCRLRTGFLYPDWRNWNMAPLIVAAIADYVRDDLGADRSYGSFPAEDDGALRVVTAAGFVEEGRLKRARKRGRDYLDITVAGRPRRRRKRDDRGQED